MTIALELPNSYGLVLSTAVASAFVAHWHAFGLSSGYRMAAKIPYPNAFATPEQVAKDPKAYAFNCAQRAHQNYNENHAAFVVSLLIAGLKYPVVAASMGAAYLVARVLYALGYVRDKPGQNGRGRTIGQWNWLPLFGLEFMAAWVGYKVFGGMS